jgi:hypothetical protein
MAISGQLMHTPWPSHGGSCQRGVPGGKGNVAGDLIETISR